MFKKYGWNIFSKYLIYSTRFIPASFPLVKASQYLPFWFSAKLYRVVLKKKSLISSSLLPLRLIWSLGNSFTELGVGEYGGYFNCTIWFHQKLWRLASLFFLIFSFLFFFELALTCLDFIILFVAQLCALKKKKKEKIASLSFSFDTFDHASR